MSALASPAPDVSSNWAGYVVTAASAPATTPAPTPSASFTDVTGSWVQTKATCDTGESTSSAFWVGLGGVDETSQGLEQLGTEADCTPGGKMSYSAWYELLPANPVKLKLKIRPGDKVTAAVLSSGQQIVFSLKDLTRHTKFSKRVPFVDPLDLGSAEWIAEAPAACSAGRAALSRRSAHELRHGDLHRSRRDRERPPRDDLRPHVVDRAGRARAGQHARAELRRSVQHARRVAEQPLSRRPLVLGRLATHARRDDALAFSRRARAVVPCEAVPVRTPRSAGWLTSAELRVGLGCMRLSTDDDRDEARALATIAEAVAAGITVFDTARSYGQGADELGHNERLLARALRDCGGAKTTRIVTKGGMARVGGSWIPDGRARTIRSDCEASLVALDGLAIDMYLVHAPDPRTTWGTTMRALARLVEEGLVTRVGVSNVNRAQLDEALELAPVAAVEIALSPFDDRALRGGVVERCAETGVAVIAHSPLGGPRRAPGLARREPLADDRPRPRRERGRGRPRMAPRAPPATWW